MPDVETRPQIESLETWIDGVWEMLLTARQDDQLVGCARLKRFGDQLGLSELFVEKESRRQGIATELVRSSESIGKALGCESMLLGVKRANLPAKALYSSLGFVDNGHGAMIKKL
jgi:ribosomal protein S18 acetylase RimI-like enzyme